MTQQPEDPAAKYIPVLTHILEICQQYPAVLKPSDDPLQIYRFCAAPDEHEWIGINKDSARIVYVEHDFCGTRERTVEEIAQSLSDYERRGASLASPRHIWDTFVTNFRQPLGRHLAKRELKGLAARLVFDDPKPQPEPEHA